MNEVLDLPDVQQPRRARPAVVVLGVAAVAIWGLVAWPLVSTWAAHAGQPAPTAADARVGECFALPGGDPAAVPTDADAVACADPHDGQHFAVGMLDGASYPGDDAVQREATETCTDAALLETLDPAAWDMQVQVYFPTEASWSEGDRAWACAVTADEPWVGSVLAG